MRTFQLIGLDPAAFAPLFAQSDRQLAAAGIVRVHADSPTAFPCRTTLQDASVGDELLLLSFMHFDVDSPYRSSGPIYVSPGESQRRLAPGEVPPFIARRLMSLRAYDAAMMMTAAEVCEGSVAAAGIERMFEDPRVEQVHLHNARRGCFFCVARPVTRVA
jgi:hypothetical protein